MDERLESWIAAERLIARYGPAARRVAEERARDLRAAGDARGAETWTLIHECVRALQAGRAARPEASEGP